MINKLRLLHYLSKYTYDKICDLLVTNKGNHKAEDNCISYPDKPIFRIQPFDILYKTFGHIWFLFLYIDFQKFKCDYIDFKDRLFEQYNDLFGKKIMADFPVFEEIICEYIEFYNIFTVNKPKDIEKNMRVMGCPPVNLDLDVSNLTNAKMPHGKIEFCISEKDNDRIETLACCFGSALKKRIKDKSLHGPVGIKVKKMVNKQTEEEIVNWLLKRYDLNLCLSKNEI